MKAGGTSGNLAYPPLAFGRQAAEFENLLDHVSLRRFIGTDTTFILPPH